MYILLINMPALLSTISPTSSIILLAQGTIYTPSTFRVPEVFQYTTMPQALRPPITLDLDTGERCILTLHTHRRIHDDGEHVLYFRGFLEPLDTPTDEDDDLFLDHRFEEDRRENVCAKLYLPRHGQASAKAEEYLDDVADLEHEDEVEQSPGDFADEVSFPGTVEEGLRWTGMRYLPSALHWVVLSRVPVGGLLEDERGMFGLLPPHGMGMVRRRRGKVGRVEALWSPTPLPGRSLRRAPVVAAKEELGVVRAKVVHRRQPSVEETMARLRDMMSDSPATPRSIMSTSPSGESWGGDSLSSTPLLRSSGGSWGGEWSGKTAVSDRKADTPQEDFETMMREQGPFFSIDLTPACLV